MVKFEQLTSELGPHLHKRLQTEYAYNEGNFRHLFDDLQESYITDIYNSIEVCGYNNHLIFTCIKFY